MDFDEEVKGFNGIETKGKNSLKFFLMLSIGTTLNLLQLCPGKY